MRTMHEQSPDNEVVAVAAGASGRGSVWINTAHTVSRAEHRLIWFWARRVVFYRPPLDVLYLDDLEALRTVLLGSDHTVADQ